jgi:HK97 family phage prohead protease
MRREDIEFGVPVRNAFKFSGPDLQKSAAPALLGKAIIGLATSYHEIHEAATGQTEIFAPGCFDESLKSGRMVSLLVNHKPELKISDTFDRLELFSDRDGLWFRFFPSDLKNHQVVVDGVADGTLRQMSVGYTVIRDGFFKMRGVSHRIINAAVLGEISIVGGGRAAVKSTSAVLVAGGDLRATLSDDVKSGPYLDLRSRIKSCV